MRNHYTLRTRLYKRIQRCYRFLNQDFYPTAVIYHFLYCIKHRDHKVLIGCLTGIDEFSTINRIERIDILPKETCAVYDNLYYDDKTDSEKCHIFEFPGVYCTKLKKANIYGGFSIVSVGKSIILSGYNEKTKARVRFTNDLLKQQTDTTGLLRYQKTGIVYEKAIYLCGSAEGNYFHFILELLPKLALIERESLFSDYPIIVDDIIREIPSLKQALDAINKSCRMIIFAKKTQAYNVKELIYISNVSLLPMNLKQNVLGIPEDRVLSIAAMYCLKDCIKKRDINKESERVYLARFGSDKNLKRFRNDRKVAEMCSKAGFKVVFPEQLSFLEQVELFMGAKYIIGSAGAANTNLVFCEPNTKIYIIYPREFKSNMWYAYAKSFGLDPILIDAKVVEKMDYEVSSIFEVDLAVIDRVLHDINETESELEKCRN